MGLLAALGSGFAGAVALNAVHETARSIDPEAPRMDVIGSRAVKKIFSKVDMYPPVGDDLYYTTLGADLLSNTAYYSLVGAAGKENAWIMGAGLGLIAGLGAVTLPEPLGLGRQPNGESAGTQVKTVCWYLLGGLASAAVYTVLGDD